MADKTEALKIGIIGFGNISKYIIHQLDQHQILKIVFILVRDVEKAVNQNTFDKLPFVENLAEIHNVDLILECGGHDALREYGPDILSYGVDIISVSPGALWDQRFEKQLKLCSKTGKSKLEFPSGAIGGLDALAAASKSNLEKVEYTAIKNPTAWGIQSNSDMPLKLEIFKGSARDASKKYPKNVNVCALIALAGIGFDDTRVTLISDNSAKYNTHKICASGDFGEFNFVINGKPFTKHPATSRLAAQSMVSSLLKRINSLII